MLAQLHKWNKKVENNFSNKINKERFKQNHRKLMIMKKI